MISPNRTRKSNAYEMSPVVHLFLREKNLKEIINSVKDHSVLTVGEMEGFLEAGGIINWFVEEKKIRFEINTAAAERAKLEIRSNLLRLAKRIVGENTVRRHRSRIILEGRES